MQLKQKQSNREDERYLLEQSFETNQLDVSSDAVITTKGNHNKRGSTIESPHNKKGIDSVRCTELENDVDAFEQTPLSIAAKSTAEESFSLDEFKDEDEGQDSTEYSDVQLVIGEHSQTSFVQFLPGMKASSSSPQQSDGSEFPLAHDASDLEADQQLLQNANHVFDQIDKNVVQPHVPQICERPAHDINYSNANNDDGKKMQTIRRRCLLIIISLSLIAAAVATALGFLFARDKGQSVDADNNTACMFCADGSIPTNLAEKRISESETCYEYLERLVLGTSEQQCQQGQAVAWMFCDCPTLPLLGFSGTTETSSCSLCPDGVKPTGKDCADFNTAVTLVGTSQFMSCEEAIAMVPNHCSCPNLEPVEQFRRLLHDISGDALEDSTSPQFDALQWIANADPAQLTVDQDSASLIRQRYVAAVAYYALGGDAWTNAYGFLSSVKTCEWNVDSAGIQCDDRDEITSIRLRNNNLNGQIPPELGFYSNLGSIDLSSNSITGSIPETIIEMDSLFEIDLNDNALSSSIASVLFDLPELRVVDLSNNALSGQLDPSVGRAPMLTTLLLRGNELNGTIPPAIGQSTMLRRLDLNSNSLTGPIPDFWPYSPIQQLHMKNNSLTGTIPASLGNLRKLRILSATNNDLVGTLPVFSGNDESLFALELSHNRIYGSLDSLFTAPLSSSLARVQLEVNLFTETIPSSLALFSNLFELQLGQNDLRGTIPTGIGNCTSLKFLDLADNELVGPLPTELAKLTLLEELVVFGNELTGSLDLFCATGQPFDMMAANSCNLSATVECDCCTHCCDSITMSCNGL